MNTNNRPIYPTPICEEAKKHFEEIERVKFVNKLANRTAWLREFAGTQEFFNQISWDKNCEIITICGYKFYMGNYGAYSLQCGQKRSVIIKTLADLGGFLAVVEKKDLMIRSRPWYSRWLYKAWLSDVGY